MRISNRCFVFGKIKEQKKDVKLVSSKHQIDKMVLKCFYSLLVIMLMISSIKSQSNGFGFMLSKPAQKTKLITTLPAETVHLTVHENSYTMEEKVEYINGCVKKCLETRKDRLKKRSLVDFGRDTCIQTECRIYERRR